MGDSARTVTELYQALRPLILRDVAAAAAPAAAGGGMAAHALNGAYHTGSLAEGQAPWAATKVELVAHAALPDVHHAAATAGNVGIEVVGQAIGLAAAAGGAGLAYAAGVLSVNVSGLGLSVTGDAVTLTSSSNPGAAAAVLASDASGYLNLVRLVLSDRLRTPTIDTASGNLTLQPAGDITIDPVGNDVLPATNYDINLGALSKKYLTLHAAELWVETLVAQNTIATIGGRILVGPTTYLSRDMGTGDTTIYVRHNQMVSGDRAYMEADGSVEFFAITSGPTTISATEYSYTVTRNLDGTGANAWYAGDAMFNTGQAGNGFIDLYSLRGVKSASQAGPTIVGNIRNSSTFNDWSEAWAIGNLNGLYGYGANTVGVGLGKYASGQPNVVIDPTNGVRLRQYTTDMIVLDPSGNSYFAGVMTIGTSGEIRQGTGTLGSNYTGLRIWRDSNVGRIGGYASNVLQWYGDTAGNLVAGTGYVTLNASGIDVASYHDSRTSTPEPGYSDPISSPSAALTYDASDQGDAWYSAIDGLKTYNGGTALRLFGSSRHAVDSGQYASSWSHYVDAVLEMPGVTKPSGTGSWFERLWLKAPSTSVVLVAGRIGINTASPDTAIDMLAANAILRLKHGTDDAGTMGLEFTHRNDSGSYPDLTKTAILSKAVGSYGRSSLHFVVDSAADVNSYDITADTAMIIDGSTRYVGIGSASPDAILDVEKSHTDFSTSFMRLTNSNASGQTPLDFYINGALAAKFRADYAGNANYVANGGAHYFFTGGDFGTGTARLLIGSTGNVGIATTSPGSALDVRSGEVRVGNTSDLYSAKIQTNGNIHAQGAVTTEVFLQMMSASTPSSATGFARMWYDGTNIKVILPGGTTKTLSWT